MEELKGSNLIWTSREWGTLVATFVVFNTEEGDSQLPMGK